MSSDDSLSTLEGFPLDQRKINFEIRYEITSRKSESNFLPLKSIYFNENFNVELLFSLSFICTAFSQWWKNSENKIKYWQRIGGLAFILEKDFQIKNAI